VPRRGSVRGPTTDDATADDAAGDARLERRARGA